MSFIYAQISTLHHHHHVEETFVFPRYEEKLGEGAMRANVEQHEQFLPKVEELEQYLKDVQEGKAKYDGKRIVDAVDSFGDIMVQHLTDVSYRVGSVVIIHHYFTPGAGHVRRGSYAR